MATQQDLQELLRLLTLGKAPIKEAMQKVKNLQSNNLRSIKQIAEAPLATVESALDDPKAAKSLQNACKARLKNPVPSMASKRAGTELLRSAKRSRPFDSTSDMSQHQPPVDPRELEDSLSLPLETNEDVISATTIVTNRAPLVLAFATELLRYTMPEQPPSSRLSLAQAVVSANSRSKAVSIGIEVRPSADEEGWVRGQPRVRIMGREIAVLKRGGYEWKRSGDDSGDSTGQEDDLSQSTLTETPVCDSTTSDRQHSETSNRFEWSVSSLVTLKKSTFVVRVTQLTECSQRQAALDALFVTNPGLESATHNAWAYRVKQSLGGFSGFLREDSFDDGETGCGDFLLRTMRDSNATDTLVVMTRWYGGILLGPDRWRIMRNCLEEALAERCRLRGQQASLDGQAVWGLDVEAMRSKSVSSPEGSKAHAAGVGGMPIHRPESARNYLLRSFASASIDTNQYHEDSGIDGRPDGEYSLTGPKAKPTPKQKTQKALELEKAENLGRLLGSIRILFDSWQPHLTADALDQKAWNWYVAVRPDVAGGPAGWGAKGPVKLKRILDLKR